MTAPDALPLQRFTVVEVNDRALDGREVPLCLRLAASLAGKIAADLGATVLKIEPPGGDPVRRAPRHRCRPVRAAKVPSSGSSTRRSARSSSILPATPAATRSPGCSTAPTRSCSRSPRRWPRWRAPARRHRSRSRPSRSRWTQRPGRSASSPSWRWAACCTWWASPSASRCGWAVTRRPTPRASPPSRGSPRPSPRAMPAIRRRRCAYRWPK